MSGGKRDRNSDRASIEAPEERLDKSNALWKQQDDRAVGRQNGGETERRLAKLQQRDGRSWKFAIGQIRKRCFRSDVNQVFFKRVNDTIHNLRQRGFRCALLKALAAGWRGRTMFELPFSVPVHRPVPVSHSVAIQVRRHPRSIGSLHSEAPRVAKCLTHGRRQLCGRGRKRSSGMSLCGGDAGPRVSA